jgi:phenylalanyl-tRNA synthetase beta chain
MTLSADAREAAGEPGPVHMTLRADAQAAAGKPGDWVTLRRARLARLLGISVPDTEVETLLAAIAGKVETTAEGWRIRRPAHRFDIRIEADLIEEVARLRGFDSIAERHASAPQVAGHASESRVSNDRLLTAMTDAGYREVITYSFVDPLLQRQLFPRELALALANAISADFSEMRVSLWTGLIRAARENLRRQQPRVRLFEIGNKFVLNPAQETAEGATERDTGARGATGPDTTGPDTTGPDAAGRDAAERDAVLREIESLAGIASGERFAEQWGATRDALDFYDVKADVTRLFALTGNAAAFRFEPAELDCLRPGRSARIFRDAVPVGWLGELHPQLAKELALPANTFVFDLEIEPAFAAKSLQYMDLAIVVDEAVPLAVLQENVTISSSGLLSELIVFDVYRGPGVDSGRKSIALGLILQDSSRTLTDVDADAVVTAVVARLRDELSASIRD